MDDVLIGILIGSITTIFSIVLTIYIKMKWDKK